MNKKKGIVTLDYIKGEFKYKNILTQIESYILDKFVEFIKEQAKTQFIKTN